MIDRPGRSNRLTASLEQTWATFADDYGLFPELAIDAVFARVDRGELEAATPRLLQLLVGHQLAVSDAVNIAIRLGDHPWSTAQLVTIQEVLDAWWLEVLMLEPGEHTEPFTPEVVLGILAGYDAPMVRWFEPWIAELDGPGAIHLASIIVAGREALSKEAWAGAQDKADQIFGWARTETVINGLALVGGTHVEDNMLSDALDRLI